MVVKVIASSCQGRNLLLHVNLMGDDQFSRLTFFAGVLIACLIHHCVVTD